MHRLLSQLRTDHINAIKLLNLFEEEVNQLDKTSEQPNYHKWQNILLYMTTYQDIFHHPSEEIIFSRMEKLNPALSAKLAEIKAQHEDLYQKSKNLHRVLSSIETDFIELDKDELIRSCKTYIDLLLSHMNTEEQFIFPYAKDILTDSDWEIIGRSIKLIDDPVFSQQRKDEFAELYEYVYAQ